MKRYSAVLLFLLAGNCFGQVPLNVNDNKTNKQLEYVYNKTRYDTQYLQLDASRVPRYIVVTNRDNSVSYYGYQENPLIYAVNGATYFYPSGTSDIAMTILAGGNVGIGTTTPDSRFDVGGGTISMGALNGAGELRFRTGFANSSSGGIGITAVDHVNSNKDGLAIYGHDGISFYTAQTQRVIVSNAGDVGIGTTTPLSKLEVNGSLGLKSKTRAELLALTPSAVGQIYFCSDCLNAVNVVVSIGSTTAGQFDSFTGGVSW